MHFNKDSMIDEFDLIQSASYIKGCSDQTYIYGYGVEGGGYADEPVNFPNSKDGGVADSHIQKVNSRSKTVKEMRQLKSMSERLQRSSYRFSPIDDTVDKELTRSSWTREEIALFCLRSMNNNVKKAVKAYKCFTTMMCKFNSKNGNEIDIHNPTILSQLRTGKVVIFDKLDLHGRLLVIINLHHHDPKLQTVDDLILLFVFVIELIMIENPHNYAAERNGLSILINASKIGFSDFRMECCLRIVQILKKNFPIKIGQLLIFKPSRLIKLSIKLVMLTKKRLKKKFQIINKIFEPLDSITDFDALSHFIDRNHIPKELGGSHDFVSDEFWENKYQGHMLAELFRKRKASNKPPEQIKIIANRRMHNKEDRAKKEPRKNGRKHRKMAN
ncbi:Sec14d domain-containing protein [Cryptosporidium canis]|uniref:Sec14d domain-containing protein n=1 Tax=Cryptosporidium canis TaxID=195482 RepID=A0ABQ8P4Z9_9CRYT|nr:Sec14d domain-containing protein [Cryptosporidium canis]KAJ1608511.1 Sec14d domain-containing protein [Cryptosporidium canis]